MLVLNISRVRSDMGDPARSPKETYRRPNLKEKETLRRPSRPQKVTLFDETPQFYVILYKESISLEL